MICDWLRSVPTTRSASSSSILPIVPPMPLLESPSRCVRIRCVRERLDGRRWSLEERCRSDVRLTRMDRSTWCVVETMWNLHGSRIRRCVWRSTRRRVSLSSIRDTILRGCVLRRLRIMSAYRKGRFLSIWLFGRIRLLSLCCWEGRWYRFCGCGFALYCGGGDWKIYGQEDGCLCECVCIVFENANGWSDWCWRCHRFFHSSSVLACSMVECRNNNCGGSGDHSRLPLWSLHYVLPLPSKEPIECQEAHSDEGQWCSLSK